MPVLWTWQPQDAWQPVPVPSPSAVLGPRGLSEGHSPAPESDVQILAGRPHWVLLASAASGVRINGELLRLGIRVLRDRDELAMPCAGDVARFYFSTEQLARVEAFPGSDKPAICPRCKMPIEPGQLAVKCPSSSCGLWHHEDAANELNCWTFARHCALCDQPTSLDAGYRWTPSVL